MCRSTGGATLIVEMHEGDLIGSTSCAERHFGETLSIPLILTILSAVAEARVIGRKPCVRRRR